MESSLMLQFTTETLEQVCSTSEMSIEVTNLVNVSDVVGVLLVPKRWPAGLAIQKKAFDLSDPGFDKVKVAVDDGQRIWITTWLEAFWVLDVHNDYLHVGGSRVLW